MKILVDYDFKDIENEEYVEKITKYEDTIKECIRLCLENENVSCNELGIYIRFTTNDEIQKINKEYREVDSPTDVLSFPMYEKDELLEIGKDDIPVDLGDIIMSIQRIDEQAKEYGHSFERELLYLTTHAMFHLLGYDHMQEDEKKVMREKEEKIMGIMNINR